MDLVLKDISLFQEIAERHHVPLEISPLLIDIFQDAESRYARGVLNVIDVLKTQPV